MGLLAKIVWKLLELLPSVLEAVRRMDAERHAKEVVEESARAVEREIAQRNYDAGRSQLVRLKAEDALFKKRMAELEGFH